MIWDLIFVVIAFAAAAEAQSPTLDADTALYILYGILGVSALVCLLFIVCITCFCCKICQQRRERRPQRGDGVGEVSEERRHKKSTRPHRLFTGSNKTEVAAADNDKVQLKHLLSISSNTSEGVSTPHYMAMSTFKAVVEDEAEVAGEKGNLETDVDITSSKQSLASAAEVKVDVAETQEGFEARREKAKMQRQQSQEHPPNLFSLLRDEDEVNHHGLGRRDSVSYGDLPGACAMEEQTIFYSKSEGNLDSEPARDKEDSPSAAEKREQFETQKNSAKKNRKGKRLLQQRDSVLPLLAITPSSESEQSAFPESGVQ